MTSLVRTNGINPFLSLSLSFLAHGSMPFDYSHYSFVTGVPCFYYHADSYLYWKSCSAVSVNKKLADKMVTKEKEVFFHYTGKAEAFSWIDSYSLHPTFLHPTLRDSIKCLTIAQCNFAYLLKAFSVMYFFNKTH